MTKKIGKDELKKLLEGVLREDINLEPTSADDAWTHSLGGPEDRTKGMSDAANLFDLLSQINDPKNKLDASDISLFVNVADEKKLEVYEKFNTDVERAMYLMKALPEIYENLIDRIFYSARGRFKSGKVSKSGSPVSDGNTANEIIDNLMGNNGQDEANKLSSDDAYAKDYIADTKAVLDNFNSYGNMKNLSNLATLAIKEFYAFQTSVSRDADQTLTSPKIDSAKAERGVFPESQIAMVEKILTGGTFAERMAQVNEISKKYREASKTDNKEEIAKLIGKDPSQILTEIMLLDLFNLLLRATSAEQARYGFEALLALIAGGSQEGATRTSGGTQGVADFVDDQGNPGSAKLYKSGTGKIDQSLANFNEAAGNSGKEDFQLHYVIGLKKQGEEQTGPEALGRGSGSPSKTVVLEVHEPIIGKDSTGYYVIPSGGDKKIYDGQDGLNLIDGGRILLHTSLPLGTSTGKIYVTGSRVETFRSYIGTTIDDLGGEAKQMLDFFKAFIESIEESKEKSKTYIASQNPDDAQKTLTSLEDSKKNFNGIKSVMDSFYGNIQEPQADPYGPQDGISYGLDESKKITANFLKKLIEESFKK